MKEESTRSCGPSNTSAGWKSANVNSSGPGGSTVKRQYETVKLYTNHINGEGHKVRSGVEAVPKCSPSTNSLLQKRQALNSAVDLK